MTSKPNEIRKSHQQRGVAMIVALLMVATLSFLALGLTQTMTRAVRRAAISAEYAGAYWQAISARTASDVALRTLLEAAQQQGGKLTPTHPLFLAPVDLPLPSGVVRVQLADATRCFNINSLVAASSSSGIIDDNQDQNANQGGRNDEAVAEFIRLVTSIGLSDASAERLVNVIADWMDADAEQGIGGAEDGLYMSLPSPFRTAGRPIADISELRAMDGMSQQIYSGLKPYICAMPDNAPSKFNLNMLRPQDAPLLAAMLGERLSAQETLSLIETRPPEGWDNIEEFWASPVFENLEIEDDLRTNRTSISSQYIEVSAIITGEEVDLEQRLVYEVADDGGSIELVKRTFGGES